jgi:hypothetical protein
MAFIATVAALFTAALAIGFSGWMLVQIFKSK